MLGFADKVEAALPNAAEVATLKNDLTQAAGKIVELEGAAKTATATIEARDASILDLQGQVTAANELVKAKDAEIATLKADNAKEKGKANETIAAQGLSAEQLPAAQPAANAGTDLVAQYDAIKDPVEKAKFRAQHMNAMFKAAAKK